MRKLLLVLPAIVILALAGLHIVSGWNETAGPVVTRDIRNNPMSREVRAMLVEAFGPDALNIVVGVEDNVAVLSGEVRERPTQKLAEIVAESVDGIVVVHNFLELDSSRAAIGPTSLDDSNLRRIVSNALASDIDLRPSQVAVEACDGVVLLRGAMPDIGRHDAAIRIAEGLSGVSRVIDLVHIAWTTSVPTLVQASLTEDLMTPAGNEK